MELYLKKCQSNAIKNVRYATKAQANRAARQTTKLSQTARASTSISLHRLLTELAKVILTSQAA